MTAPITKRFESILFWFLCGTILASATLIFLPTFTMAFTSDDFFLLQRHPGLSPLQTIDFLHRPLRNLFFYELALYFKFWPVPYRIWIVCIYLLLLWNMFLLLRSLEIRPCIAAAVTLLLAVYPRMGQVLFWFAASQDLVVALSTIALLRCILQYRRDESNHWPLIYGALWFSLGIGFKENMIIVFGLVAFVDLWLDLRRCDFLSIGFLRPYLYLSVPAAIYLMYSWVNKGLAQALVDHPNSGYGYHGILVSVSAMTRSILSLLTWDTGSVALKSLTPKQIIEILLSSIVLIGGSIYLGQLRALLCFALWAFFALLPTALFAPFYTGDRYFLCSMIGIFILLAVLVNQRFKSPAGPAAIALTSLAFLFVFASSLESLLFQQSLHIRAAHTATKIINQTLRYISEPLPAAQAIVFFRLPHSILESNQHADVLGNGLAEALVGSGASAALQVAYTSGPTNPENQLATQIFKCTAIPIESQSLPLRFLRFNRSEVEAIDPKCALSIARESITSEPNLWVGDRQMILQKVLSLK